MTLDDTAARTFLFELYTQTKGDTALQVSQYDIGSVLGLDQDQAAETAQALCIQGSAELKTLSGGIGITAQGLSELDVTPAAGATLQAGRNRLPALGHGPALSTEDVQAVTGLVREIKQALENGSGAYPALEQIVLDMKTLEVQMLAPEPGTEIVRAVFQALALDLERLEIPDLAERIRTFTGG